VATGLAAVAAAPLVLGAAGFTAGGVAAGSIAASVQSAVYGGSVASGSVFALLQSAGAAGIGAAANATIAGTAGGITAGFTALGNYMLVCFNCKSYTKFLSVVCVCTGCLFISVISNWYMAYISEII